MLAMIDASAKYKYLVLIVDHGDTLNSLLRDDVLLDGVPIVISHSRCRKGKEVAVLAKLLEEIQEIR